ncbi:uncharacterized protein DUF1475 [Pseudomonas duriflava]|uniref:Uncharacterized protein DUF1475 n=1 Tax=Pseudomonas duriflava TaxID=459528 RepID=A0A562QPM5_9PSED|nr:DUF1475 family protein [Pseudomonas duriflava]TWI58684.1 uncharacterized protein DUF1475 [Pseudomonas duriflava]
MKTGMIVLRLTLVTGWVVLLGITLHAVAERGLIEAPYVFLGDLTHPWRAQFNTDFSLNLLLIAAWVVYRARSWRLGLVWGFLTLMMGALFTLPYLLVVTLRAHGDMRVVLLGRHYSPRGPR